MYQECKESSFWPSIALASVKWGTGGFEEACHMQAGVCLNRMGGVEYVYLAAFSSFSCAPQSQR